MRVQRWSPARMPACYSDPVAWRMWCADRRGLKAPCTDCTPEHRDRMHAQGRCERPETLFVVDTQSGDLVGITADSDEYADLLLGKLRRRLPVWPWCDDSAEWRARIGEASERAHKATRRAIVVWMRRLETA